MGKSLKGKELGVGITQRKDGLYQASFTDSLGKRHFVYGKTVKEATEKLYETKKKIAIGTSINPSDYTLDEWFNYWLKTYKSKCRNTSKMAYVALYNSTIKATLGHLTVDNITAITIQTALGQIEAPTMKTKAKGLLLDMFNWLNNTKILSENVVHNVYVDNPKPSKKKRFLEDYEVDLIKQYGRKRSMYNFFIIALNTGMRGGEIIALKWKNIDLDNDIIHVEGTYVEKYYNGESIREDHPTKTEDGTRDIPMTREVKELFLSLKNDSVSPEDRVLKTNRGNVLNLPNIDTSFAMLIKTINKKESIHLEKFSAHAVRRTFATNAIKRGMNPKVLQYLMGHSSYQMTMDLYCQLSLSTIREEMACMNIS